MSTKPIENANTPASPTLLGEQVEQALHQVYRYLMERAWLRQLERSNDPSTAPNGSESADANPTGNGDEHYGPGKAAP